jgi:hypothetical protein
LLRNRAGTFSPWSSTLVSIVWVGYFEILMRTNGLQIWQDLGCSMSPTRYTESWGESLRGRRSVSPSQKAYDHMPRSWNFGRTEDYVFLLKGCRFLLQYVQLRPISNQSGTTCRSERASTSSLARFAHHFGLSGDSESKRPWCQCDRHPDKLILILETHGKIVSSFTPVEWQSTPNPNGRGCQSEDFRFHAEKSAQCRHEDDDIEDWKEVVLNLLRFRTGSHHWFLALAWALRRNEVQSHWQFWSGLDQWHWTGWGDIARIPSHLIRN